MKRESEKRGASIRERLTAMFELPKEIVLNLPLISHVGNREITVENYKSLLEYSATNVRINTSAGVFRVSGRGLTLKHLTAESVTISGGLSEFGYILG